MQLLDSVLLLCLLYASPTLSEPSLRGNAVIPDKPQAVANGTHPTQKSAYKKCYRELQQDIDALLDFKQNVWDMYGLLDSWTVENSCNLCARFKHWNGISCNGNNRVLGIDLRDHSLAALPDVPDSLSASFGSLTELTAIYLSLSQDAIGSFGLTGAIPKELNNLKNFRVLDLSNNKFSGQIPDLSGTSMGTLLLPQNWLSGELGDWFGKTILTSLDLSSNILSGNLPEITSENVTGLQTLSLGNNQFTGEIPGSFRKLTQLKVLDLQSNNLAGPLPDWLPDLNYNIQQVLLSNNSLSGEVPKSWTNLRLNASAEGDDQNPIVFGFVLSYNNLSGNPLETFAGYCTATGADQQVALSLDLSFNAFSGAIPEALFDCLLLQSLDLSYNSFSGALPRGFIRFDRYRNNSFNQISDINLSHNNFSGEIRPHQSPMNPYLTSVDLSFNHFQGSIPNLSCTPPSFGGSPSSVQFSLQGNNFTGEIPRGLLTCNGLITALDLSANSLSGNVSLFQGIWGYNKDTALVLNVSYNNLEGPIVLPNAPRSAFVFSIDYSHNQLIGDFPPSLPRKLHLNYLDVSFNGITSPPSDVVLANMNEAFYLNFSNNQMRGILPTQWAGLQALTNLSFGYNQLSGPIPGSLACLGGVQFLDLRHNSFTGEIDPAFGNLSSLRQFLVDGNALSETLPLTLAAVPMPYKSLELMNFSRNGFSGSIPSGFAAYPFPNVSLDFSFNNFSSTIPGGNLTLQPDPYFLGNSLLCTNRSSRSTQHGYRFCSTRGTSTPAWLIVLIVLAGLILMMVILFLAMRYRESKREWKGTFKVFLDSSEKLYISTLVEATNNFDKKYILGSGGFGTVYKAKLNSGLTVAIKRLHVTSVDNDKEVHAEMDSLGNINHKHLVRLIAAFIASPPSTERLLVYEFMPNGTLQDAMDQIDQQGEQSLMRSWEFRKKMALHIARGLRYLHHQSVPRVIHRDMKPENVLLDADMNARIADFGLARLVSNESLTRVTAAIGTVGYISPETVRFGRASVKSDVYAFGVMLLQLVSGLGIRDPLLGELPLHRWIRKHSPTDYADKRIKDWETLLDEMEAMTCLGLLCLAKVPNERPSMEDALEILENLKAFILKMRKENTVG